LSGPCQNVWAAFRYSFIDPILNQLLEIRSAVTPSVARVGVIGRTCGSAKHQHVAAPRLTPHSAGLPHAGHAWMVSSLANHIAYLKRPMEEPTPAAKRTAKPQRLAVNGSSRWAITRALKKLSDPTQ
jgi:hypothetical protein